MTDTTSLPAFPIPAFEDNYVWLLRNGPSAVVVDPGDATPVLDHLDRHGLSLTAILLTHHHDDHTGGVAELTSAFHVPVYGPRRESIAGVTHGVEGGERIELPELGAAFEVLDVAGHTNGHVAYYGIKSVFCGDALFGCGCGRLFEGTAERMCASLARLAALPDDTLVYCAHEYTLENIAFAKVVEPDNLDLLERERLDRLAREHGKPTVPSTMGLEKRTNPFLRWNEPEVISAASRFAGKQLTPPTDVFAAIRVWRDRFG